MILDGNNMNKLKKAYKLKDSIVHGLTMGRNIFPMVEKYNAYINKYALNEPKIKYINSGCIELE